MRIDLAGWTREATLGDHQDFLGLFERADALGFDGVWFNEFHFRREGLPYPSTLLLAAAVFARTARLRVGLSILVLPLYHPLLLAEWLAQLDWQSGGRLDVGIGRGTDPATFAALGLDPADARARFAESYAILRDAWRGPTVAAAGEHWRFAPVAVGPPPVQQPGPPLYVASSTPETLAFAAERELPLLLSLEPPEGRQLATYREALAHAGRPDALAGSSLSRYICLGATPAEAEAQLDTLLPRLHERRRRFAAGRGVAPADVPAPDPVQFRREQTIVGDPASCVAQIVALRATTGIGQLRCVFNGNGVLDNVAALTPRLVIPGLAAFR